MAHCDTCGNDYNRSFEIVMRGKTYTFDCFECAIHALAPTCTRCGCRVIGHGVEAGTDVYCCVHCASIDGVKGLRDDV